LSEKEYGRYTSRFVHLSCDMTLCAKLAYAEHPSVRLQFKLQQTATPCSRRSPWFCLAERMNTHICHHPMNSPLSWHWNILKLTCITVMLIIDHHPISSKPSNHISYHKISYHSQASTAAIWHMPSLGGNSSTSSSSSHPGRRQRILAGHSFQTSTVTSDSKTRPWY